MTNAASKPSCLPSAFRDPEYYRDCAGRARGLRTGRALGFFFGALMRERLIELLLTAAGAWAATGAGAGAGAEGAGGAAGGAGAGTLTGSPRRDWIKA